MPETIQAVTLPAIPSKKYFTIGEVSQLCEVKPHVLRYWEQEFPQLKTVNRRGNRRYYQQHDILLIRQIRALLYQQGFTIEGARKKLQQTKPAASKVDSGVVDNVINELEDLLIILKS